MSCPPVIFVLVQADVAADGGVSSAEQIICGLRNHRPVIVTDRHSDRVTRWQGAGIETHIVPQSASVGMSRGPLKVANSYARYTRKLLELIETSGAKVIHANDPAAFQLALPAVKLRTGVKIALNIRDTIDPQRRPPRSRYRLLFGMADHVFYLTEDMAERWAEIAPSAKRACSVTYSIVDPAIYAAAPPWSGDGPPVVLISGLVCAKKGQLEFIRQVSPKLAVEGIETWLAGDFDPARNSYMAACAAAAAPLEDSVQFLGYRSDVAALMRRATVIAVASRYEGLVRAMIEAMSCARPVVSFDVCSAHEMLERESEGAGAVVEAGDFPGMAAAIIDYCRDPVRAASAGEKGRLTATRLFGRDSVVERYERVYDMLAAGTAAPAPA